MLSRDEVSQIERYEREEDIKKIHREGSGELVKELKAFRKAHKGSRSPKAILAGLKALTDTWECQNGMRGYHEIKEDKD
jgi:hypothetical protein